MLKELKQSTLNYLRRHGIKVIRVPKDGYQLNRGAEQVDRDGILRIVREETEKNPTVRPTWTIAKHYLDRRRISFYCDVVDLLAENQVPIADRRVLEIGSCFGVTLWLLHQRYPTAKLHGIEVLEKALAAGRRLCPVADIRGEAVGSLSFDTQFDVVIMTEVLEHMADPDTELQRLDGIVAPGGYLLLTVPNGRYDSGAADEFMPAFQSYRGHVNFWSPESWRKLLERVFPTHTVRTGYMPKDHIYQLFGLIGKPASNKQ